MSERRRRRGGRTAWWLRAYAGATGAVLIALGGVGLLFSPTPGPAGSLFQVLVGALFAYAGLGQRDPVVSRRFVGGMGVLLLLGVGVAVCARLLLGGGAGAVGPVQGACVVVGIASVLVARRAEPGVLLAAVSAFAAACVAALGAATTATRARVRRRRRVAPEEHEARPVAGRRGETDGKHGG